MNIFAKYANSYINVFDVAMSGEPRREGAARGKSSRQHKDTTASNRQMTQMGMTDAQRDQRW
ncbi:MAG: hypothetical protein WBN97_08020 [Parvibaculum sp.]